MYNKLKRGEASLNYLIRVYKRNAKKRNIEFSLTKEQFRNITKQNCYYCGVEPKQKVRNTSYFANGNYIYNGIDRVDNSKGYVIDNCKPCCGICNKAKDAMSEKKFENWIKKVFNHLRSKNATKST